MVEEISQRPGVRMCIPRGHRQQVVKACTGGQGGGTGGLEGVNGVPPDTPSTLDFLNASCKCFSPLAFVNGLEESTPFLPLLSPQSQAYSWRCV